MLCILMLLYIKCQIIYLHKKIKMGHEYIGNMHSWNFRNNTFLDSTAFPPHFSEGFMIQKKLLLISLQTLNLHSKFFLPTAFKSSLSTKIISFSPLDLFIRVYSIFWYYPGNSPETVWKTPLSQCIMAADWGITLHKSYTLRRQDKYKH